MAISRLKTWIDGEVLTHTDLNAEFDNIVNNVTVFAVPFGANITFDTDNAYDIGADGASRPRDLFLAGEAKVGPGTEATPSYSFDADEDTGLRNIGANRIAIVTAAADRWEVTAAGHLIAVDDNTYDIGADGVTRPRDLYLAGRVRVGAGTEAAPAFSWDADQATGLRQPAASRIMVVTAGADRWEVSGAGHLLGVDDNTYDIGASGATRPRDLWLGRNADVQGTLDVAGATTLAALLDVQANMQLSGDISPATLTGDVNDYAPAGLATASTLRLASDAKRTITGLTGGADGRIIVIQNVGANVIAFTDEDAGSLAANRFALEANIDLAADSAIMLRYDATSSRWRLAAGAGGGGGSVSFTFFMA